MKARKASVCVVGDVHGHLQLALGMAARWQQLLHYSFDVVCLCGDVGTFTSEASIDDATQRHAARNPCELEFLNCWMSSSEPTWISRIFLPLEEGGLGLVCPIVMIHGNHEDFEFLRSIVPKTQKRPQTPVAVAELPTVDRFGHIHYLPSGWQCISTSGLVIAGIGGIESKSPHQKYDPMAYLDQGAIRHLQRMPRANLLISHQGPATFQPRGGSTTLNAFVTASLAEIWCHGHSTHEDPRIHSSTQCTILPLHDVAFHSDKSKPDDPGKDAWAAIEFFSDAPANIRRERPACWPEFQKFKWISVDNTLVAPILYY